jgi:hypothetical protein
VELGIAEELAGIGDGRNVDGVEVGIDADDDAPRGCHDGGVLSVGDDCGGDNPAGRADKTLMRNGQAPD